MKKMKGLRRLIGAGMVFAMTLGLTACGDSKTASADPALAKQYVYSYENIALPEVGDDVTIRDVATCNDRVYLIMEIYHWDEYSNQPDIRMMSMKADGTDVQTLEIELPKTESTANADEAVDEEDASQIYENTGFNHFVIGNDSKVYAIKEYYFEDYSNPENYVSRHESTVCAWDLEGKLLWQSPMENLETEDSYSYVSKLVPTDQGLTVLISGDSVSKIEVDVSGNASAKKELPNGKDILYNAGEIMVKEDGTLLVPHYNEDWTAMYLTTYDLNTDTVGEENKLPDSFMWNGYSALTAGVTTDIAYSNSYGVYGYNIGDEQPTQLMDYVNSDLNTSSLQQLVMLDETHFIGFYYDNIDYKNIGAIFTKKNPEEIPDKEVVVLAGEYIGYDIKARVIDFNRNNQEYRIVLKEYDSYNTMDDYTAGVTQLNNDIISGNMPDILLYGSTLPMESYISKGLLADVGKLIEADEELSKVEFMENVFDAYKVNEKLYYVVPSFSVSTYVGKTALLGDRTGWTAEEFVKYVESLPEETNIIGELTRDAFMYQIMQSSGSDFVDVSTGKCNFDSPDFIAMLEFAKSLPVELTEDYYGEDYWMNYDSQYREERTVLMPLYLSSFTNLSYNLNGYFGEDVTFVGFPTNSGNGAVINATDSPFALSAKSKNLDGAWEFVRSFLTEEYQKELDWGLPVSKEVFMAKSKDAMGRPFYLDEAGEKVEYDDYFTINGESVVLEPLTQEQVEQVVEVITATDKLSYYNEDIQNIVAEEAAAFFEGQKSAAEVTQVIQSRVQIYVDENR